MSQDILREEAAAAAKPILPYKERPRFPTCSTCGISGPHMVKIKGNWKCPTHQPDNKQEDEDASD